MTRYLLPLLLVVSLAHGQENVYYDNVVVVVDGSGSMSYDMSGTGVQKMKIAKDALKTVLKNVGDNTQIGIIAFGRVNQDWVYPIAPKDISKLNMAIDGIGTAGGTPLGEYIKKGADALLQQREKQRGYGSYRLLVVTDGEATDQSNVDKYVPDVKSRGIVLDVIGVDMSQDHGLAKLSNYRRANNPVELQNAIQEVFAEVSTKENLEEDFELIEPIPNELAQVIVKSFGNSGNYPIGDKPKSKPQKVINPDGSVSYVMPDDPGSVKGTVIITLGGVVLILAVMLFIARTILRS